MSLDADCTKAWNANSALRTAASQSSTVELRKLNNAQGVYRRELGRWCLSTALATAFSHWRLLSPLISLSSPLLSAQRNCGHPSLGRAAVKAQVQTVSLAVSRTLRFHCQKAFTGAEAQGKGSAIISVPSSHGPARPPVGQRRSPRRDRAASW